MSVAAHLRGDYVREHRAAGLAYVTPHARRRFQQRIAALDDAHALAVILHGLVEPLITIERERGRVWSLLCDADGYLFRAVVAAPHAAGLLPVVTTIKHATSGKSHGAGREREVTPWRLRLT